MALIKRDEIIKLAHLSRLSLTEAEVDEFSHELEAILNYVEQLKLVDTTGLAATTKVSGNKNITRPDVIKSYGYDVLDLLKNVPALEDNQIKVKRMIG
ncbi:MAG: Asp-tRNA(Asn)/Glu-tRNA(Gln) amidotransferase subunit GatC [Candidatus Saccharimonadales bacterium]